MPSLEELAKHGSRNQRALPTPRTLSELTLAVTKLTTLKGDLTAQRVVLECNLEASKKFHVDDVLSRINNASERARVKRTLEAEWKSIEGERRAAASKPLYQKLQEIIAQEGAISRAETFIASDRGGLSLNAELKTLAPKISSIEALERDWQSSSLS